MKHHRRPAGRIGRCSDRRRPYLQRRCGAGRMWAPVRLLKQRRAFTTEVMSTITVMSCLFTKVIGVVACDNFFARRHLSLNLV
jgi:hypothetical protein